MLGYEFQGDGLDRDGAAVFYRAVFAGVALLAAQGIAVLCHQFLGDGIDRNSAAACDRIAFDFGQPL